MKHLPFMLALCFVVSACDSTEPYGASETSTNAASLSKVSPWDACWGQATAVYAAMGVLGEHASGQEEPRSGLKRLAHELYEAGVLSEDSIQALGAWVAAEEGLSIDACIED